MVFIVAYVWCSSFCVCQCGGEVNASLSYFELGFLQKHSLQADYDTFSCCKLGFVCWLDKVHQGCQCNTSHVHLNSAVSFISETRGKSNWGSCKLRNAKGGGVKARAWLREESLLNHY